MCVADCYRQGEKLNTKVSTQGLHIQMMFSKAPVVVTEISQWYLYVCFLMCKFFIVLLVCRVVYFL